LTLTVSYKINQFIGAAMRELNQQELKNVSGSTIAVGSFFLVTDDSTWSTLTGYMFYAHRVTDPSGKDIFNGAEGALFIVDGATIQARSNVAGNGTYYLCE